MSKVKLSAAELAMACNAAVLLTKNSVINKVYQLFGQLSEAYANEIEAFDTAREVKRISPKISKGENYQGLPWVMLDYPRFFSGNNIFAIRTMFWWGNHFSQFIILKGAYLPAGIAIKILELAASGNIYLCTSTDQWEHHFDENNMVHLNKMNQQEVAATIKKCGFLKLGTKIPIERWESVENNMKENFINFVQLSPCFAF